MRVSHSGGDTDDVRGRRTGVAEPGEARALAADGEADVVVRTLEWGGAYPEDVTSVAACSMEQK